MQRINEAEPGNSPDLSACPFPLDLYETTLDHSILGSVGWHWHEFAQFCVVLEGRVRFSAGRKEWELCQGAGICLNPGLPHRAAPVGDGTCRYLCVDFDPRLLPGFCCERIQEKYGALFLPKGMRVQTFFPGSGWTGAVLDQLRLVHGAWRQKGYGYELEAALALGRAWLLIIQNTAGAALERGDFENRRLKEIISYLRDHYGEKVTLAQVAQAVQMSQSECCRFFKKSADCTIFEYLLHLRLQRAIELLERTDLSVSQIAYATGFSGTSYFIGRFRRAVGMTPKAYREKQKSRALS